METAGIYLVLQMMKQFNQIFQPRSGDASCLDNYIVSNHSAKVELAYVVQKHNPIRAWITGQNASGQTLTANTNLTQEVMAN